MYILICVHISTSQINTSHQIHEQYQFNYSVLKNTFNNSKYAFYKLWLLLQNLHKTCSNYLTLECVYEYISYIIQCVIIVLMSLAGSCTVNHHENQRKILEIHNVQTFTRCVMVFCWAHGDNNTDNRDAVAAAQFK